MIKTLILVFAVVGSSFAWIWFPDLSLTSSCLHSNRESDQVPHHPYWFGETDLNCMIVKTGKKKKRHAPQHRNTWEWTHRWIKYRDHYFVHSRTRGAEILTSPPGDGHCFSRQEKQPAGWGVLDVECIKNCTRKYETLILVFAVVGSSFAWIWFPDLSWTSSCLHSNRESDQVPHHPYWFGETDLNCMIVKTGKKKKRHAPQHRNTWEWTHRWIKYRDHYFVHSRTRGAEILTSPPGDGHCFSRQEKQPAGWGVLDVECIKNCTRKYEETYGTYHIVFKNCHMFANLLSDVLCDRNACPDWCY